MDAATRPAAAGPAAPPSLRASVARAGHEAATARQIGRSTAAARATRAGAVATPSVTALPRARGCRRAPRPGRAQGRGGNCGCAGPVQVSSRSPRPDRPIDRLRPAAERHGQPAELGQAARDQRGARILAEPGADHRPGRDGDHVLRRAAELGADRVVVAVEPESRRAEQRRRCRRAAPASVAATTAAAGSPARPRGRNSGRSAARPARPDALAAATSSGRRSVPASTPLAASSSGAAGPHGREHAAHMLHRHRHARSTSASRGSSPIGRDRVGQADAGQARALPHRARCGAGSRAHSVTALPARAAWMASAVPQAPAPMTATLLIGEAQHRRALPRLAVAEQRAAGRRGSAPPRPRSGTAG